MLTQFFSRPQPPAAVRSEPTDAERFHWGDLTDALIDHAIQQAWPPARIELSRDVFRRSLQLTSLPRIFGMTYEGIAVVPVADLPSPGWRIVPEPRD